MHKLNGNLSHLNSIISSKIIRIGQVDMSCFAQMFGDKLKVDQSGTLGNTEELLKDKVVGIYFSAHWCPPCRSFTPELIKTYKTVVEVSDILNDVSSFKRYMLKFSNKFNKCYIFIGSADHLKLIS